MSDGRDRGISKVFTLTIVQWGEVGGFLRREDHRKGFKPIKTNVRCQHGSSKNSMSVLTLQEPRARSQLTLRWSRFE